LQPPRSARFFFWAAALELNQNGVRGKRICSRSLALGAALPLVLSVMVFSLSLANIRRALSQFALHPHKTRPNQSPSGMEVGAFQQMAKRSRLSADVFIGLVGLQKQMKFLVNQKRIPGMTDILWGLGMKQDLRQKLFHGAFTVFWHSDHSCRSWRSSRKLLLTIVKKLPSFY
jgi:hypothetical protein